MKMEKSLIKEVKQQREYIDFQEQEEIIKSFVRQIRGNVSSILILPPDYTRKHSGTGRLAAFLYKLLKDNYEISIMPALGTHSPMTEKEIRDMFGQQIPLDIFVDHDFINDTVKIGEIKKDFVGKVSEGNVKRNISVEINKRLVNGEYDLIISIGQVLPHGVVGMANYNKNILVGCGGQEMIDISHFVGAVYGMERLLGKDHSPVRKILDRAQNKFLNNININYILTVNSITLNPVTGLTNMLGIFIGEEREIFEKAVKLSQKYNIIRLEKPISKLIVFMNEEEFKSTWLACKAIYRTRMAIADGGELVVLTPGLKRFGEFEKMDKLIRKYGYVGKEKILEYIDKNEDLAGNLAAAAHLIHGSTEGRFRVTFATDHLTKEELTGVNFNHMRYEEAVQRYQPDNLVYGYNKLESGKEVFFIENPATGLWTIK